MRNLPVPQDEFELLIRCAAALHYGSVEIAKAAADQFVALTDARRKVEETALVGGTA